MITTQPVSQLANIGNTVGFHVVATGASPTYRWNQNGIALTNGGDFSGTTTPDLSVHVTTPADIGVYTVIVSNLAASVTSAGAALRVNQTATNFFDDFEAYSLISPIGKGRGGTPLDYDYLNGTVNSPDICPWGDCRRPTSAPTFPANPGARFPKQISSPTAAARWLAEFMIRSLAPATMTRSS